MSNHAPKIVLDEDRCIDVFSVPTIILSKPRWVSDNVAVCCRLCGCSFSHLRRKHHCRQCGQVFCSACCKSKCKLPHLGYDQSERVCNACLPVAHLISNAISTQQSESLAAVESLTNILCEDETGLKSIVDLGGLHAMIFAARNRNTQLWSVVLKALHTLVNSHPYLIPVILQLGAVNIIVNILQETESGDQLIISCLHLLAAIHINGTAISAHLVHCVLPLCSQTALSLPALQCLRDITHNASAHAAFINSASVVTRLMCLLSNPDEMAQEVILHIFVNLSTGAEENRHRIIQEDIFNGNYLSKLLHSRPTNQQVLCNAACLVANLAASDKMQMAYLCPMVDCLLTPSSNYHIRYHIVRVCLALLALYPDVCLQTLQGRGALAILHVLGQDAGIMSSLEDQVKSRISPIDSLEQKL